MIKTEVDINQQLKTKISIALNYIFWGAGCALQNKGSYKKSYSLKL